MRRQVSANEAKYLKEIFSGNIFENLFNWRWKCSKYLWEIKLWSVNKQNIVKKMFENFIFFRQLKFLMRIDKTCELWWLLGGNISKANLDYFQEWRMQMFAAGNMRQ